MHIKSILMLAGGAALVAAGVAGAGRHDAGTGPHAAVQQAPRPTLVVRDVRVFDGETVLPKASVLVKDGTIAAVAADLDVPTGAEVVDGRGKTLLPGLFDAHTHTWGDALERALVYGVTTELDMFTNPAQVAEWRAEQKRDGAPRRADIYSAGTLITAPKGHGTQFGQPIPTLTQPADAAAFVDARIAEGSDYIKVVFENGAAYGLSLPSLSADTLRAVIAAARRRNKLALVHVGSQAAADEAIAAGANGLVHIFADGPPAADFAARAKAGGVFVVPTLSVVESAAGHAGGAAVAQHPSLKPFVNEPERTALSGTFPQRSGNRVRQEHAIAAVRALHAAGVPILAGSDAPNPGTAHGVSLHRELELLVSAGLSPREALTAATSVPATRFSLTDRGRIAPGLRADLVLVDGDPTADITATRAIVAVWKAGVRLDRTPAPLTTPAPKLTSSGEISDFDGGEVTAAFGTGWQISTDTMMGGASQATMGLAGGGAGGSKGALAVSGRINPGAPFPWAGAMFFPSSPPMTPVDLSAFKELSFWTRGDGRTYQVMLFATRLGNIPAAQPFAAGPEWREVVIPLQKFGTDGQDVRGLLFSADASPGDFAFRIDSVRLR